MFLFKYQDEIVCLIVFLHIYNSYLTPLLPKRKEQKDIFKKYQTNNKENFSHFFYR